MIERLKEIIVNYVEVDADSITADSRFIEDLGFNSYDFMSMLGELEGELGVMVSEEEVVNIHTVGEAAEYLEKLTKGEG